MNTQRRVSKHAANVAPGLSHAQTSNKFNWYIEVFIYQLMHKRVALKEY